MRRYKKRSELTKSELLEIRRQKRLLSHTPNEVKRRRRYRELPQNKENRRRWSLMRFYGITLEDYDILHKKQRGLCAICLQKETSLSNGVPRTLSVDHDHKTGRVRGLLCKNCNYGLGYFEDNTILRSAINYLGNVQTNHSNKEDNAVNEED